MNSKDFLTAVFYSYFANCFHNADGAFTRDIEQMTLHKFTVVNFSKSDEKVIYEISNGTGTVKLVAMFTLNDRGYVRNIELS